MTAKPYLPLKLLATAAATLAIFAGTTSTARASTYQPCLVNGCAVLENGEAIYQCAIGLQYSGWDVRGWTYKVAPRNSFWRAYVYGYKNGWRVEDCDETQLSWAVKVVPIP